MTDETLPDTKEARMSEVKEFTKRVLDKYGKYVKAIVMMGSVAREEFKQKSDIDIFVIIDDTAFEITPELHDEIDAEMEKIAQDISKNISIQPSYTLTEFWDYARIAHPIIYNFIKEGIPVYDAGFFAPIKRLLDMGRIPSTREAIESYMEGADKKIMRAKTVKLLMLAEDCYYSMLNTAQAVLMFMSIEPPVPNKAYDEVLRYLVEPGVLEMEYAEWLRDIIEIRKKIEHKELLDVQGSYVDEWLGKAEKFVDKMFSVLGALELRKKEKILERTHEVMIKAAITALKTLHNLKLPDETKTDIDLNELQKQIETKLGMSVLDAFKKDFVDSKRVGSYYMDIWKKIDDMRAKAMQKQMDKIPDKDVYEMREYVRDMIRDLAKVLKDKDVNEVG